VLGCANSLPRPQTGSEWNEFLRACRAGDQRACYWKGSLELSSGNTAQGVELMVRACDAGVGMACNEVGFFHSEAKHGFKRDGARAVALWKRACEQGSKDGCDSWGTGLRDGVGGPIDLEGAVAAYERACKLDDAAGCTNLGAALLRGAGTKANPARAEALWRKVCAQEEIYRSCRLLGAELVRGELIKPREEEEGLAVLRRACNLGRGDDCLEAALAMRDYGSKAESLRYLRTSCAWESTRGCRELGKVLSRDPAEDAQEESRAVLQKACERKDDESCKLLAPAAAEPPAAQP
jgi:TPR repeat protein